MEETEVTTTEETAPIEAAIPAEGLEQTAEPAEAEETAATDETAEAETEEVTEGEKQSHQTTAFERIQELVAKNKQLEAEMQAKTAALEQKLEKVMSTQRDYDPDLQPVDTAAVNSYIANQLEVYDQLKLEGRGLEALELLDAVNKLRADVKAHEAKRTSKLTELQQQDIAGKTTQQVLQRLNQAAAIVKAEYKLTDEVFNAAAVFFQAEQTKSPVLAARYAEIVQRQGEMAAILFAKDYCDQHMGKTQEKENQKREESKQKLPPAATATSSATASENVNKLYAEAMKDPHNSDKYNAWKTAQRQLSKT